MKKLFLMMILLVCFISTEVVLIAQEKQIEDTLKKAKTKEMQEKRITIKEKKKQKKEAIIDQVVNDLNMLCQSAFQYKLREGNYGFIGFDTTSAFAKLSINPKIRGKYSINGKPSAGVIQFKVLSPKIAKGMWIKIDSTGTVTIERP